MPAIVRPLIVLLLTLCCAVTYAADIGDLPHDELGETDSNVIRITDKPGTVRIVTFWASWCAPCLHELPVLVEMQKQVGSDALQVYAINYKESRGKFRRLVDLLGESDVLFLRDRKGKVGRRFGVDGIPHTVLIGKNGRIAYQHIGYGESSLDTLVDEVNELLQTDVP